MGTRGGSRYPKGEKVREKCGPQAARGSSEVATCHCGARWTGKSLCHCAGCHRSFGGVGLFDRHRSHYGEHGKCLDPEKIVDNDGEQVMFYRAGVWRGPELTEEQKIKAGWA